MLYVAKKFNIEEQTFVTRNRVSLPYLVMAKFLRTKYGYYAIKRKEESEFYDIDLLGALVRKHWVSELNPSNTGLVWHQGDFEIIFDAIHPDYYSGQLEKSEAKALYRALAAKEVDNDLKGERSTPPFFYIKFFYFFNCFIALPFAQPTSEADKKTMQSLCEEYC